jgi:hypothetical protein
MMPPHWLANNFMKYRWLTLSYITLIILIILAADMGHLNFTIRWIHSIRQARTFYLGWNARFRGQLKLGRDTLAVVGLVGVEG